MIYSLYARYLPNGCFIRLVTRACSKLSDFVSYIDKNPGLISYPYLSQDYALFCGVFDIKF